MAANFVNTITLSYAICQRYVWVITACLSTLLHCSTFGVR